jgi:anti-anti-sigma factor
MPLDIQESRNGNIVVITMIGKLAQGGESQAMETLLDELVSRGEQRVVFDMSAVTYIDSAGIGMLAMAAGKMREAQGKLVVVSPNGSRTTQLLKLTQMNLLMTLRSSMAEAAESFA